MSDMIHLEAARIPDRDRLLETLMLSGQDAQPVDELGIDVRCANGADEAARDIFGKVEATVVAIGEPFVPIKHDGVIYVRPPVS